MMGDLHFTQFIKYTTLTQTQANSIRRQQTLQLSAYTLHFREYTHSNDTFLSFKESSPTINTDVNSKTFCECVNVL